MIKLYHGTNTTFNKVELDKCLPYKDFGRGFYLTTIRTQALVHPNIQYAFCTERAIALLQKI